MGAVNDAKTMTVTRSLAMSEAPSGGLICIRGNHIGQMLTLPPEAVKVFGRDAVSCDYVLTDEQVSRTHCQITFIPATSQYRLIDNSKNGTFLGDGTRLEKGREYYLKSGTEIFMGNKKNCYKLK